MKSNIFFQALSKETTEEQALKSQDEDKHILNMF